MRFEYRIINDIDEVAEMAGDSLDAVTPISITPESWKRWLLSEHSPIRAYEVRMKWYDIPYYAAMHIRTHSVGILPPYDVFPMVRSQRPDCRNAVQYDRRKAPQDAPVNLTLKMNAQAIITVSRKRMCANADQTTREAWSMARHAFMQSKDEYLVILGALMRPDCWYRGGVCYEFKSCGECGRDMLWG